MAGSLPMHIAFAAPSVDAVDSFYQQGMRNGGLDKGPPGNRPSSTPYYAAYLIDPDGNNVEAGYRGGDPPFLTTKKRRTENDGRATGRLCIS